MPCQLRQSSPNAHTALGRTPAHTAYCVQIYLATSPLRTDYSLTDHSMPAVLPITSHLCIAYVCEQQRRTIAGVCVCVAARCGAHRLVMALRPAEGRKL